MNIGEPTVIFFPCVLGDGRGIRYFFLLTAGCWKKRRLKSKLGLFLIHLFWKVWTAFKVKIRQRKPGRHNFTEFNDVQEKKSHSF